MPFLNQTRFEIMPNAEKTVKKLPKTLQIRHSRKIYPNLVTLAGIDLRTLSGDGYVIILLWTDSSR